MGDAREREVDAGRGTRSPVHAVDTPVHTDDASRAHDTAVDAAVHASRTDDSPLDRRHATADRERLSIEAAWLDPRAAAPELTEPIDVAARTEAALARRTPAERNRQAEKSGAPGRRFSRACVSSEINEA